MPAFRTCWCSAETRGKGKVTGPHSVFDVVCRYAGGANAGHTVLLRHKACTHQVPSGVMYENTHPVIGNGCIVDPEVLLLGEIDMLEQGYFLRSA